MSDNNFQLKLSGILEIVLIIIALIMPIAPSKTGSKSNLPNLFFDKPSYFEEVIFYWLFSHLFVLIVIIIVMLVKYLKKRF